jgi:hypothetical protein
LSYLLLVSLVDHEWCDTGSCPSRSIIWWAAGFELLAPKRSHLALYTLFPQQLYVIAILSVES